MGENFIKTKSCKKVDTTDFKKQPNGWLLELFSDEDNFTKHIKGQVYLTVAEPGIVKGFHLHAVADYYLTCLKGRIREVIYRDKNTKEEIELGDDNFRVVQIPRGHPHAIINVGKEPAYVLIYRYPAWSVELDEQFDIAPEDIETETTWGRIKLFTNRFKRNEL